MKLLNAAVGVVKSYTLASRRTIMVKTERAGRDALIQKYLGELKASADGTSKKSAPVARAPAPAPGARSADRAFGTKPSNRAAVRIVQGHLPPLLQQRL